MVVVETEASQKYGWSRDYKFLLLENSYFKEKRFWPVSVASWKTRLVQISKIVKKFEQVCTSSSPDYIMSEVTL